MTKLEMENINERIPLKKYFYDKKSSAFLWVCVLLAFPTGGISLLVFLGAKIAQLFINFSGDENKYDRILEQDINYLKDRAVNVMGIIPEELSIIEPIVTHGYASESNSVKKLDELDTAKKDFFQECMSFITSIPKKIISFLRNLFTNKDNISHSVFFEGRDEKVRGSLISFTMISFTEQQIIAYTCNYDIALGIILEEYVREMFYRDVASIGYGGEILHIFTNNGKLLRMPAAWTMLTSPSGKSIFASMTGENDLLEDQIMAMKNLIRSKKEEMA